MSLLRTLVDGFIIKIKIFMVKTTGVRGPTLAPFDSVLVLLFEGRTPCSTSYESLFKKEEYSHSTSHCTSDYSSTSHLAINNGNERWTVNQVPARITRRAGAPLRKILKLCDFEKFSKFRPKYPLSKKLQPNRTFLWHYHFSILLALSTASIHNLNLLCHSLEHLSMIF